MVSNLIVTAMVATAEQIMVAAGRPAAEKRLVENAAPSSAWSSSAPSTGSRDEASSHGPV